MKRVKPSKTWLEYKPTQDHWDSFWYSLAWSATRQRGLDNADSSDIQRWVDTMGRRGSAVRCSQLLSVGIGCVPQKLWTKGFHMSWIAKQKVSMWKKIARARVCKSMHNGYIEKVCISKSTAQRSQQLAILLALKDLCRLILVFQRHIKACKSAMPLFQRGQKLERTLEMADSQ